MKKISENRYQHSATLFKFCKEALRMRYAGNVKVIDQDVGALLGYDPADCSHWKKGKKNIRALASLRSIADYLGIDQRLLIDMVFGRVSLDEGVFEYKGYGDFELSSFQIEACRKEYFRNPEYWAEEYGNRPFDEIFHVDRVSLGILTRKIIERSQEEDKIEIDMTKVIDLFDNISIKMDQDILRPVKATYHSLHSSRVEAVFSCKEDPKKPYMRFLIAKELYKFLVFASDDILAEMPKYPSDMLEVLANLFAGFLLIPECKLAKEGQTIDSSRDFIEQMSERFGVSKVLMNRRMQDHLACVLGR